MDFTLIIELEKKLLDPSVRKSAAELNNLISDDFVEFGTSGRIYDKKIILERLVEENSIVIEAFDFQPIQLGIDVVQLRFKTHRKNDDGSLSVSLRSSLWKCNGGQWQMIFHQGTKTTS